MHLTRKAMALRGGAVLLQGAAAVRTAQCKLAAFKEWNRADTALQGFSSNNLALCVKQTMPHVCSAVSGRCSKAPAAAGYGSIALCTGPAGGFQKVHGG